MFNEGDVLYGKHDANNGYWVIEAIENGKAKLRAVDKIGRPRSTPRGPSGKRRFKCRKQGFETLSRRYLWRKVSAGELPDGFINPVKAEAEPSKAIEAVEAAEPKLSFDVEQRKLTIDGHPLVFERDWTVPVPEVEKALGYSQGELSRSVRRWSKQGEMREGEHYGQIARKQGSPLRLTEVGLYQVCLLTRQPVGVALREFLSKEVLPAIQRGRSVAPSGALVTDRQLNASLEALGHQLYVEFVRQLHERHVKALNSIHGRGSEMLERLDQHATRNEQMLAYIVETFGAAFKDLSTRLTRLESRPGAAPVAPRFPDDVPTKNKVTLDGYLHRYGGLTPLQRTAIEGALTAKGVNPIIQTGHGRFYDSRTLDSHLNLILQARDGAAVRVVD